MYKKLAALAVMVAALLMAAVPAMARTGGDSAVEEQYGTGSDSIRGAITDVTGSTIFVESNPGRQSVGDKGYYSVTGDTEILEKRDGELVPASFEDLSVGLLVEATYTDGPRPAIYPPEGEAARIVILGSDPGTPPDDTPEQPSPEPPAANPDPPSVGSSGGTYVGEGSSSAGYSVLPDTGGAPVMLGAGISVLGAGLLARRMTR